MSTQTNGRHPIMVASNSAPPASRFSQLRPSNLHGGLVVLGATGATTLALYLSASGHSMLWLAGQIVMAFAMLHWFVLIHEAGHKTLFKSATLNKFSGHLASFLAGIPFECWIAVHALHHRWTGWQDLDATTAGLVPRRLATWERLAVNSCWRFWIPLFSVLYRVQNYWNLPRLIRLFPRKRQRLATNLLLLLAAYLALASLLGMQTCLQLFGLSTLFSLMMQDILILSQHTHIPMELSQGRQVTPFAPAEQEIFTRSLKFPRWFSTVVLLNLDAHELHHIYPSVPGYYLDRIDYHPHNTIAWWRWLWRAKQVPGAVLLFQNSKSSGIDI